MEQNKKKHKNLAPDDKNGEAEPKRTEYKFVLCEHTLQNLEEIIEALQDCDVIALECIGVPSEVERERMNLALTAITKLEEASAVEKDQTEKLLSIFEDDFYKIIVNKFENSGKIIKLIDINADHPDFTVIKQYNASSRELDEAMQNLRPNAEIREVIKNHIMLLAATSSIREKIMSRQLKLLGEQNKGAKIGVMLGAVHTPVFDDIAEDLPAVPVFVGVDKTWLSGHEEMCYTYADRAAHALQHGAEDIDPELVDRALLEEVFIKYNNKIRVRKFSDRTETSATSNVDASPEELNLKSEVIEKMSADEVAALLARIDTIKLMDRGGEHPLLASIQVNNEINELLRDTRIKYL